MSGAARSSRARGAGAAPYRARGLSALFLAAVLAAGGAAPASAGPSRSAVLDLARRGWIYDLGGAAMRRPRDAPAIAISARSMRGARICVLGERPHPATRRILAAFGDLVARTSGTPLRVDLDAPDATGCAGEPVVLRLFSTRPPDRAFEGDLARLDAQFGIGLPPHRRVAVTAPAQAQTFFGRRGQATHILVMQPPQGTAPDAVEGRFFASILIEELYQAFSFGMDILLVDPGARPISKLQERPVDLRGLRWGSERFMAGMLATSPAGLCGFDVSMLHALGRTALARTNSEAFLDEIAGSYETLAGLAAETLRMPGLAPLIDPACAAAPE